MTLKLLTVRLLANALLVSLFSLLAITAETAVLLETAMLSLSAQVILDGALWYAIRESHTFRQIDFHRASLPIGVGLLVGSTMAALRHTTLLPHLLTLEVDTWKLAFFSGATFIAIQIVLAFLEWLSGKLAKFFNRHKNIRGNRHI